MPAEGLSLAELKKIASVVGEKGYEVSLRKNESGQNWFAQVQIQLGEKGFRRIESFRGSLRLWRKLEDALRTLKSACPEKNEFYVQVELGQWMKVIYLAANDPTVLTTPQP
ncbi:hypothetical protein [Chromobacterium vaccinii]|uniref:hypothetical protein n=1 Tax=Chromobacterium vaccinii TaxID=1108595 RepID=UPI0034577DB1